MASSKRIDDELEAEKLLALVNGKDADVSELKKRSQDGKSTKAL